MQPLVGLSKANVAPLWLISFVKVIWSNLKKQRQEN